MLEKKIQQAWYTKQKWVWFLFPFMLLFLLLTWLRRRLYKANILASKKADIPVLVVGNITVGGNGKTPLVIAIVEHLQKLNYKVAVLSRGYGGSQTEYPHLVNQHCDPDIVGDEPALIAKRVGCDVVIDPKRVRGCEFIQQHTQADIIICDDGLQHYAMARDMEICVLDKRGVGNGFLLPMGPLREGVWRLKGVDFVVYNQGQEEELSTHITSHFKQQKLITMHLVPQKWVNVKTQQTMAIDQLNLDSENTVALAGIGDPSRFFRTLSKLKIGLKDTIALPDHHKFVAADIPQDHTVLMTEKDAVKCVDLAHDNCWYLQIAADINKDSAIFKNYERLMEQIQLTIERSKDKQNKH